MKKFLITALCVVCVCSCLVGLVACVNNASNVTASAQEEVQATNVVYNNYEISLSHAPLHFYIPYETYQTLSPSINYYFTNDILSYRQGTDGQYLGAMDFVFQVVDDVGNIYYENVGRAGTIFNTEINTNGQYRNNLNSYSSAYWSGSVQSLYQVSTGGRVFYPIYTTSSSYPFKIYISSYKNLNLTSMRVRSCALHDLQVYGASNESIWSTYRFVSGSASNYRELLVMGILEQNGFAACNVSLGVGSFSMQCLEQENKLNPYTRDTFGIAIKATYCEDDKGTPIQIFKNPKESTFKKSQRGCCLVVLDDDGITLRCEDGHTFEETKDTRNALITIFEDGVFKKRYTLAEIRDRLHGGKF